MATASPHSQTPEQQGRYIFPSLVGPGYFNTDLSLQKGFTWGASESKKLSFRFSGYNFINHPNRTFLSGDTGLILNFDNSGKLTQGANAAPFGYATNKIGHRIMQAIVRFSW